MDTPRDHSATPRLGMLGGTFDPVHRGHLETADAARRRFALDEVLLIPSSRPPHKHRPTITDPRHRLAMVRLAVADRAGLAASDIELRRGGPSYTVDTVAQVKRTSPPGTRLFFLLGTDAFLEFDTWKSYNTLLHEVPLVVLARGGVPDDLPRWKDELSAFIRGRIDDGYRWQPSADAFVHPRRRKIHLFDGPRLPIAATDIRRRLRRGEACREVLPAAVAEYIQRERLYR